MISLGSGSEILFILVLAVLIVKPEDLPKIMSYLGKLIGKMRTFSYDIQWQLERLSDTKTEMKDDVHYVDPQHDDELNEDHNEELDLNHMQMVNTDDIQKKLYMDPEEFLNISKDISERLNKSKDAGLSLKINKKNDI